MSDTYDLEAGPIDICVCKGIDGAWVIFVDTERMDETLDGPYPLRINLNDEPVFANPEYPADG